MTPAFGGDAVDIVVIASDRNFNAMLNFIRTHPWIRLFSISQADAYKYLSEHDNCGIGCYVPVEGHTDREAKHLRVCAMARLATLQGLSRGLDLHHPVAVVSPQANRPSIRSILTLNYKKDKELVASFGRLNN
jgi:hypothetical protein